MLRLITGAAGSGKTFSLMNQIEKAAGGDKRVIVVIPEQFSFEYERMLYERLGIRDFNRIEVLSFTRLAREIFISGGGTKGRPADDTVRTAFMFRALNRLIKNKSLTFYEKTARRGFTSGALSAVKELILAGKGPEDLMKTLPLIDGKLKGKVSDIAFIYSEYLSALKENGYKDSLGDISYAAKTAAETDYFMGAEIFMDEFKSFTADQCLLTGAAIKSAASVTICLTAGEYSEKKYSVFETTAATAGKLKELAGESATPVVAFSLSENPRYKNAPDIAFLSANIMRPKRGVYSGSADNVSVYEASDPYNEADAVCSEIRRLVMGGKYKYSGITVLCRRQEVYSTILESAFGRYDIPFYTDEKKPAEASGLVIFIKALLEAAAANEMSSEVLFRALKPGFLGLSEDETAVLEDYCYTLGIDGKLWDEPFPDENAEAARLKALSPIKKLRDQKNGTAAGICEKLFQIFDETGFYEALNKRAVRAADDVIGPGDPDVLIASRETKRLWGQICGLFEALYKTSGDENIGISGFAELFSEAAAGLSLSAPPQTLDSVGFLSSYTARLNAPEAVFIIGVQDGEFPLAVKDSGIFTERDRRLLNEAGLEISDGLDEKTADERFSAYAALSAPSEKLYVSYSLSDIKGGALYPSYLIGQIIRMFPRGLKKKTASGVPALSFCLTPKAAYYQFVQNYGAGDSDSESLRSALSRIDEYARRIAYLDGISEKSPHAIAPTTCERLYGGGIRLSASRFEDHQKCPFMYFCKTGLKIYPKRKIELNAAVRGNVIHYCLCEILKKYGKKITGIGETALSDEIAFYMDEYYSLPQIGGSYAKTGRFNANYRRTSGAVADILENMRAEFSQSDFIPDGFELNVSPLKIRVHEGMDVTFAGKADRADIFVSSGGEKFVRVIDYKTGTYKFDFKDLYYGLNSQLLLYLFALIKADGRYKGCRPAGFLYAPASSPPLSSGGKFESAGGIVLDDDGVIEAMEKGGAGIYIPVKKKKDGYSPSGSSYLIKEKAFSKLWEYSERLITGMSENLSGGNILALPLSKGGAVPCDYCDYGGICGNYPDPESRVCSAEAKEKLKAEILYNNE